MLFITAMLKTKGVLNNPVILTDLWEQNYILHTVRLPAYILYNLDPKSALQCLKNGRL